MANNCILIVDTSRSGIGLVLKHGSDIHSAHITNEETNSGKQSVELPSAVEKFIKPYCTFKDLTSIGVVVGPGSFTGIRLGIAYVKGLAIGLGIPVVPINAFEIYLEKTPNAFVAIDSGRSDLFVAAADLEPGTMEIEEIETFQMQYPTTVGHKPYDLSDGIAIIERKLNTDHIETAIPMYLRPSYAEVQKCCKN